MSQPAAPTRISNYWRSLDELDNTPEFQEFLRREFPQQAEDLPDGVSRRRWMQIMGASFTLASVQGCRWQTEKIAPFAERPEGYVPGTASHFATSIELAGGPKHLMVTCYDGRPVKVEGNPEHPGSRGATDVFAQSITLSMYDPDRQATPIRREAGTKEVKQWAEFETFVGETAERLGGDRQGKGFAVLMPPVGSLSIAATVAKLTEQMPEAKFYQYAPISRDNELAGAEQAFGKPLRTHYKLADAKVIATFDCDLLLERPDSVTLARDFSISRDVDAKGFTAESMSRLYSIESQFTSTGSVADHRMAIKSAAIPAALAQLRDLVKSGAKLPEGDHDHDAEHGVVPSQEEFLTVLAADLLAAGGKSVVAVGAAQPAEAHAIAHEINSLTSAIGKNVVFTEEPGVTAEPGSLADLVGAMAIRQVDTLLMIDVNPVYDAPVDLEFAELLSEMPHTIHLSTHDNETSRLCEWSLPATHPFEAWGDATGWDGTVSVGQPLITPLMDGRSSLEVLALFAGDKNPDAQQIVRNAVSEAAGELSDDAWKQLLHDGLLKDSAAEPVSAKLAGSDFTAPAMDAGDGLEVVFRPSASTYDGRFANNGWLQETPEFITKLTWDNAAIMDRKTANKIGVKQGDLIDLYSGELNVEMPVFVVPGTAEGSIGIALGYGRTAAGRVGGYEADGDGPGKIKDVVVGERGNWGKYVKDVPLAGALLAVDASPVGHNSYQLRSSKTLGIATGVTAKKTGRSYQLATTQDHFSIDQLGLEEINRRAGELVREGTIDKYQDHEDFAQHVGHHVEEVELWEEPSFDGGQAWGMAIDLNKCIGCNACSVACQSENNVPVVGKDQVARGREMHWIRIDRYFRGNIVDNGAGGQEVDYTNPQVAYQPVACQHCETAPCEQVCPVAATVHSDEGLNDMVYNRCIGTRYCANNCPFKVRRFNFFSYTSRFRDANNELLRMVNNPEVTVRSRGVMEKCTYCVQRIAKARITAKTDGRDVTGKIEDGEIVSACQQACPSQAITFGDLNDKSSKVAKLHAGPRSYGMLDGLHLKPRTQYLARIRNPHPALEKYYPKDLHGGHGGEHGAGEHGAGHGDGDHGKHDHVEKEATTSA